VITNLKQVENTRLRIVDSIRLHKNHGGVFFLRKSDGGAVASMVTSIDPKPLVTIDDLDFGWGIACVP
jgi:hypothetical protein